MQPRHDTVSNDIYDLIRATTLPKDPTKDTDWQALTRKHAKDATKQMRKFMRKKVIEVSNYTEQGKSIIRIGRSITITIE